MALSTIFTSYTRNGKCGKYSGVYASQNNINNRNDNIDNNSLVKCLFNFHPVFPNKDRRRYFVEGILHQSKVGAKRFWY